MVDISGVGMKLCRDIYSRWQVRTLADGLMFGNAKALWLETADSIGSVNRRHKVAIQETNSAELKIFDLESRINALINGFLEIHQTILLLNMGCVEKMAIGEFVSKMLRISQETMNITLGFHKQFGQIRDEIEKID